MHHPDELTTEFYCKLKTSLIFGIIAKLLQKKTKNNVYFFFGNCLLLLKPLNNIEHITGTLFSFTEVSVAKFMHICDFQYTAWICVHNEFLNQCS